MSPAWQTYLFWRRLFWALYFGAVVWFFPAALASEGAAELWGKDIGSAVYFALMIPWGLFWLYAGNRAASFSCPRCGRPFFCGSLLGLPYRNTFAGKCLHCGLPKWTEPDVKPE
jgi:hypothetical protein